MQSSPYQNLVMEMLNENNINALLPPYHVSKIYPVGHPNTVWWNFENDQERKWPGGDKSVFGFLLQNRWEQRFSRDMSTLIEFRQRITIPLIDRGLDVNLHILDYYSWSRSTKSTYPNELVELIRNGLSNFNTSCPVSLASILIFEACTKANRSGRP